MSRRRNRHADASDDPVEELVPEEVIQVELTDELDLHNFAPREVADLVEEYLHACAERAFPRVRIVHGKGRGTLRRTVHTVLERHPCVERFVLADETAGSWGATVVWLKPA